MMRERVKPISAPRISAVWYERCTEDKAQSLISVKRAEQSFGSHSERISLSTCSSGCEHTKMHIGQSWRDTYNAS